ncbi:MAG TPA: PilX N-terminal domain-containing pilus assembly protein [Thermoanaerobaculia bacterium]|nr:PilX N-terminal domain-containing pilus assembly protein [Thermoanaerobaculia bacterium]
MSSERASERGSAYVTVLLALVVLTILALALALITRTEVQVGANERQANRTFYSADSGLGVAAAEALARGRYVPTTLILNETQTGSSRVADRVEVAPLVPVLAVRCDWCPANDDGVPEFWKVHHAATATAQRVSWTGAGEPPPDARVHASKTLSAMFEFQPWPTPPVESIADPEALRKIKF